MTLNSENRLFRKAIMSAHELMTHPHSSPDYVWADASLNAYCEVGSQLFRITSTTHVLRTIILEAVKVAGPKPDLNNRVKWLDDIVADIQMKVKRKKQELNFNKEEPE